MILSNNIAQKTHYEIIGVNEDASHEVIRKTYRSALLNSHPDKLQTTPEATSNPEHELCNEFLDVQRAWEILADPESRALYDIELQTLRQDALTADDVTVEDMTVEDDGLHYHCRCGDYYSVEFLELEEMGCLFLRNEDKISLQISGCLPVSVILPCGSCSLKVRLSIGADITLQTELNG